MTPPESAESVKSRAYLVWSEWGPNMSIPRADRLASEFPDVPEAARSAWLLEFSAISSEISAIAEAGAGRTMDLSQFSARLRTRFPFMSDAAVSLSWTLANYYAWHDGNR